MNQNFIWHRYLLCVVIPIVLLATSVSATVIRVKADSPVNGPGNDWSNAYKTVAAAISASASGDQIWVARGIYKERFTIKSGTALYGGFAGTEAQLNHRLSFPRPYPDQNQTTLDGSNSGAVVTVPNSAATGTLIDGFNIINGTRGIYCNSSSSSTISNNTISGNSSDGIYCKSSSSSTNISNNTITGNTNSGIWCDMSSPSIANNVVSGNGWIGICCMYNSVPITNNTITGNGKYGITSNYCNPVIKNNIVAFNGNGVYNNNSSNSTVLNNNCIYNPEGVDYINLNPGSEDISQDPQFVSLAYGQFHIQPGSPCIDSGLNNAVQSGWKDIDNQNRIIGARVDIGVDESDGVFYEYNPVVIRVSPNGLDANDGSSWELAKKTVQAGIDSAAMNGGDVWVAAGTYTEHITMRNSVYLYGGFEGTETTLDERDWRINRSILDGNGTGNVVSMACGRYMNSLDGFGIRNGSIGIYCYNSTATIMNNTVTNNAKYGIQCYMYSSPYIANNIVAENSTHGIYCTDYSSPIIVNNVITDSSQYGIYCLNSSAPTITNNTLTENGLYGIYISSSGYPYITNNIIAFNGNGIHGSSAPVLNSNCVFNPGGVNYDGISAGVADFSQDPGFVSSAYGRLHIQPNSPCVDRGLDSAVNVDWKDMDGQERILGASVDVGADESDGTFWSVLPAVACVSPNGNDGNDGSSWALAKRTVQAGIDAVASAGGEVWTAAGIYSEHITLKKYTYIYGGFAGVESTRDERNWAVNKSILDGSRSGNVITANRGFHVSGIDGFVVRNGDYGIYCYASPSIVNNTITENSSSNIYCNASSPSIANNVITGGGQYGIYNSTASPSITNNTISGNCGYGIYDISSSKLSITNNIVAFNQNGISSYYGSLNNNCVYNPRGTNYVGMNPGATDINADPKFVSAIYGKLHIQPDSPCVNAGLNSAVQSSWKDMDAQDRIQGGQVDIGADESDGTAWTFTPSIVHVSPDGLDTNDGSSWTLAKRTVQAGIDAATSLGGEVWVAAGTYMGNVKLRQYLSLYGGFTGTESVREERNWTVNKSILNGNGRGHVVEVKAIFSICALDGFTITNGETGLISSYSSLSIANNFISSNAYSGLECSYSTLSIVNNTVMGNGFRGISCQHSAATITNNKVMENGLYGIECISSDSSRTQIVANNTVYANGQYGIRCNSSSASLINNTITANGDSGIDCYSYSPTIKNNIVAFNKKGISKYGSSGTPILSNNCVYNPEGTDYEGLSKGDGDISQDPKFVSTRYGRLHIQPDSPCINAGLNSAVQNDWKDMDGQERIQDGQVDMGADESDGSVMPFTPLVIHVSPTGSDTNDGLSWSHSKKTVQAAVDAAVKAGGGEIWVAAGTYYESIGLRPYIYMYGGFTGNETVREQRDWSANKSVLDSLYDYSVVIYCGKGFHSNIIDGFTLIGEYFGIFCSQGSPIIANNTVLMNPDDSNSTEYAIYCADSSPSIINNTITGSGRYGIYCDYSYPFIQNNIIYGMNDTGIYCNTSSPFIVNNTISGNSKYGIYYDNTTVPNVENNIVVNNIVSHNGNGIYMKGSAASPTLISNCVYNPAGNNYTGISAGASDIALDPVFVNKDAGDYHIKIGSPCINVGNDTYVQPGWFDMDGESRIQGVQVDIGADETTVPKTYTLSATVKLGDYFGLLEGIPVTIELFVGGETKRTENTTLDAEGKFHIQNVEPGTYDVGIKPSHWLRKIVPGVSVVDGDLEFEIR